MTTLSAVNPVCAFCDERHELAQTEIECDAARARTTAGRWLTVEGQISAARDAMKVVERELGALGILDETYAQTEELEQVHAAYQGVVSNLLMFDAFTALLVRMTGVASERAGVALKRERDAAMAKAEAMQSARWCGACKRDDVAIVAARSLKDGSAVALCALCNSPDVDLEVRNGNRA